LHRHCAPLFSCFAGLSGCGPSFCGNQTDSTESVASTIPSQSQSLPVCKIVCKRPVPLGLFKRMQCRPAGKLPVRWIPTGPPAEAPRTLARSRSSACPRFDLMVPRLWRGGLWHLFGKECRTVTGPVPSRPLHGLGAPGLKGPQVSATRWAKHAALAITDRRLRRPVRSGWKRNPAWWIRRTRNEAASRFGAHQPSRRNGTRGRSARPCPPGFDLRASCFHPDRTSRRPRFFHCGSSELSRQVAVGGIRAVKDGLVLVDRGRDEMRHGRTPFHWGTGDACSLPCRGDAGQ